MTASIRNLATRETPAHYGIYGQDPLKSLRVR